MFPLADRIWLPVQWCDRNILIPVTLCFILGTMSGRLHPALIHLISAIVLLILLSASILALSICRHRAALLLCLPLFFLIGHLNTVHHLQKSHAAGHIRNLLDHQQSITLVGTLAAMVEQGEEKSRFELNVHEVLLHDRQSGWLPVHGKVRLSMRGAVTGLEPGMNLMILAKAGPIKNYKTPGAFDYRGYMAARGIFISGWIRNRQDIIRISDQTEPRLQQLRFLPERVRQQVAQFIQQRLDKNVSGLYQALLIGSRAGVAPEVLEQFKATGTMHLLAISGIHMGLLGLMIGTLLNWLFRRSQWLLLHVHVPSLALTATLPILVGYAFIAGMNTPVLRSLIMATIVVAAVILRRQHSLLHLIAAAVLLVLTLNPLALFTVSFQLSFAAVTTLAIFLPQLSRPGRPEPEQPGRLTTFSGYLKTALLVSLTATVGTLPFMLFYFNRFSPIGPVMNLVVEPFLCFWALPWGLAAIPFIFFAPQAAALLFKIGGLGITAGQYCTALGAAVPFASIWTIRPFIWEIILYALLVLAWRLQPYSPRTGRIAILAGILLTLHFSQGLWFPEKPDASRITFLDVGQGAAAFMHLPDGSRILVDGGGSRNSSFNVGERIIAPYLRQQRIWRLDAAIITHPHSDHFSGMDFVLPRFQPKILYVNGDRRSEGNYREILRQAGQLAIEVTTARAGQDIVRGRDFRLEVLGMNGLARGKNPSVNDNCLVLKYSHGRRTFLLPADISAKSEAVLVSTETELGTDVLLAAHHGSATSNSRQFIAAAAPAVIVVSAGKNGQAHYPAPTNLTAWRQQKIHTYITRNQGTISCTTDGNRLNCSSFVQHDL